ncbi:MAG: hypothetical protein JWN00_5951 [Actinomycetia bacterium]|nr:hypothetical protein [Actinomycetes bacterium]
MMTTIVPSPMYMTGFLQRIHVDRATSHWSQPPVLLHHVHNCKRGEAG